MSELKSKEEFEKLLKELDETHLKIFLVEVIQKSFVRGIDYKAHTSEENHEFIMNLAESQKKKILKDKRFKFIT